MNILLVSPLVYPVNENSKYVGIEKLVWQYSKELVKRHKVTVLGHKESTFPAGVEVLSYLTHNEDT